MRGEDVFIEAAQDGVGSLPWQTETFADAESWDEKKGRYKGLVAGLTARILDDGRSV